MHETPLGWSRELLNACLATAPQNSPDSTLDRAHELQSALLHLELDWSLSQSRFYDHGQVVFLGSGGNVDIDLLELHERESSYELC